MKRLTQLFLLTLLTIVLIACGDEESTESVNEASAKDKIVVNIANLGFSTLNVAKDAGILEEELAKHNATFEYSVHQAGPPINEGIASKRVDFAVLGEGAVIGGANNKLDTKLLSIAADGKKGINTIIATKKSGVQSVEQLKGKKIAVGFGTSNHVFLLKVLDRAGLSADDVTLVNLAIPDGHPAFQTNQVDAWATVDLYANIEAANGAVALVNAEQANLYSPNFYVARGEFAEKNPEIVKAILTAIDRAIELKQTDEDKYYDIAAKAASQEVQVIKANEIFELLNDAPSEELLQQLQESSEILKELEYVANDIDVKSLVDTSYIDAIK
jgi:sulfonate transport system substrate-binding protein